MRLAFCAAGALARQGLRGRFVGSRVASCRGANKVHFVPPSWQATLSTEKPAVATTTPDVRPSVEPISTATALRTHTCGELRSSHVGTEVRLQGWAHAVRDRGGVLFILLRDRHGIVQVTVQSPSGTAKDVRLEYVVDVRGTVALRDEAVVNEAMVTGTVEVIASEVSIVSMTRPMPFLINEAADKANEDTRLKYRYLDLRRPVLQQNLAARHSAALAARNFLDASGFVEVETPVLTSATPEGARDYLVPSRIHPSRWYALPQSPQLYKQLLMVGGMDRYFQITKCFRDEDLRIDRQPEFTQIDLEMSFVQREDVMRAAEGVVRTMFERVCGFEVPKIRHISYKEAMDRYGVDAPDMRFGMLLNDISQLDDIETSQFAPVKNAMESGGMVKAMVVEGAAKGTSRKIIDGYTAFVKGYGCSGLLYGKVGADSAITGPFGKICEDCTGLVQHLGAKEGDLILCAAGKSAVVNAGLGRLRVKIGEERGLMQDGPKFAFCWVVDFPLFEFDEDEGRYMSVHHPFTKPVDEHVKMLESDEQLGEAVSDAYDLVCNGNEIGGGSIRISDGEIQRKVFQALKIGDDEQREKFGFLLDALAYGAPPHGGLALGLDRCLMIMTGADGIREVIAFPKTTSAADLMAGAPSVVPENLLYELGVRNVRDEEKQ